LTHGIPGWGVHWRQSLAVAREIAFCQAERVFIDTRISLG
jgi:hypothetical protein